MNGEGIEGRIDELVAEEEKVRQAEAHGGANDASRAHMLKLKVALDVCWDLLRRRRAAEEYGHDPDALRPRDEEVVENYRQ